MTSKSPSLLGDLNAYTWSVQQLICIRQWCLQQGLFRFTLTSYDILGIKLQTEWGDFQNPTTMGAALQPLWEAIASLTAPLDPPQQTLLQQQLSDPSSAEALILLSLERTLTLPSEGQAPAWTPLVQWLLLYAAGVSLLESSEPVTPLSEGWLFWAHAITSWHIPFSYYTYVWQLPGVRQKLFQQVQQCERNPSVLVFQPFSILHDWNIQLRDARLRHTLHPIPFGEATSVWGCISDFESKDDTRGRIFQSRASSASLWDPYTLQRLVKPTETLDVSTIEANMSAWETYMHKTWTRPYLATTLETMPVASSMHVRIQMDTLSPSFTFLALSKDSSLQVVDTLVLSPLQLGTMDTPELVKKKWHAQLKTLYIQLQEWCQEEDQKQNESSLRSIQVGQAWWERCLQLLFEPPFCTWVVGDAFTRHEVEKRPTLFLAMVAYLALQSLTVRRSGPFSPCEGIQDLYEDLIERYERLYGQDGRTPDQQKLYDSRLPFDTQYTLWLRRHGALWRVNWDHDPVETGPVPSLSLSEWTSLFATWNDTHVFSLLTK